MIITSDFIVYVCVVLSFGWHFSHRFLFCIECYYFSLSEILSGYFCYLFMLKFKIHVYVFFLTCVGCFVFDTRKSPELPTFWVFYKAFVSLRESRSLLGLHYNSWTLLTVIRWQVFNKYYNCVIIMYNSKFHKQGLTGVKNDINFLYFFSFSF